MTDSDPKLLAAAARGGVAVEVAQRITDFKAADLLEKLARQQGASARLRHAIRLLRADGYGREPIEDADALERVQALLDSGLVKSINAACDAVARELADDPKNPGSKNASSIARRLCRKFAPKAKKSPT